MVPPANRRVEFNGSGAPSGMMAQPKPRMAKAKVPSAVLRPTRWTRGGNPRSGRFVGGEDFWCYLPKRAGLSKVTRPSPKGGRNPCEGKALASLTLSHISQTGEPKKLATPHPGPLPQGEREADRKPLRLHGRDHKQKPQP